MRRRTEAYVASASLKQGRHHAGAYNVISAWVARAIREIGEDLVRAQAIDEEALKGLPAARMKIEGGKLWLRIFEQIQKAISRYAPAGEG
jgi:hypothetical protein